LSFWANRSFFLIGELLLGNLSKTVVVHGNAPHDRPGFLVGHLIGNRASLSAMAGRRNDLCVVVGSSGGPPPPSPPAEIFFVPDYVGRPSALHPTDSAGGCESGQPTRILGLAKVFSDWTVGVGSGPPPFPNSFPTLQKTIEG